MMNAVYGVVCSFLRIDEIEQITNKDIEKSGSTIDPCGIPSTDPKDCTEVIVDSHFLFLFIEITMNQF